MQPPTCNPQPRTGGRAFDLTECMGVRVRAFHNAAPVIQDPKKYRQGCGTKQSGRRGHNSIHTRRVPMTDCFLLHRVDIEDNDACVRAKFKTGHAVRPTPSQHDRQTLVQEYVALIPRMGATVPEGALAALAKDRSWQQGRQWFLRNAAVTLPCDVQAVGMHAASLHVAVQMRGCVDVFACGTESVTRVCTYVLPHALSSVCTQLIVGCALSCPHGAESVLAPVVYVVADSTMLRLCGGEVEDLTFVLRRALGPDTAPGPVQGLVCNPTTDGVGVHCWDGRRDASMGFVLPWAMGCKDLESLPLAVPSGLPRDCTGTAVVSAWRSDRPTWLFVGVHEGSLVTTEVNPRDGVLAGRTCSRAVGRLHGDLVRVVNAVWKAGDASRWAGDHLEVMVHLPAPDTVASGTGSAWYLCGRLVWCPTDPAVTSWVWTPVLWSPIMHTEPVHGVTCTAYAARGGNAASDHHAFLECGAVELPWWLLARGSKPL